MSKPQNTLGKYRLDDKGNPVAEPNLMKWAHWFETANRHVAKDRVGKSEISTVFLGLDHNFTGRGQPILWETMIFGGKLDNAATNFHARLYTLISKSDPENRARLRLGFPNEVQVWEDWHNAPDEAAFFYDL